MIICFIILNYVIIGYGHSKLYRDGEPNDPNIYVCRHMARDIEDLLESVGLDVRIIAGWNHNNSAGHMWVKLFGMTFDSVSLLPYHSTTYTYNVSEYRDYDYYLLWRHVRS